MNSLKLTCIILLLGVTNAQCQENAPSSENRSAISRFVHHDKIAFKLDYFGELGLHPGLTVGVDYTLKRNNWATVHWDVDLGGFWHRWNNTSLFLKSTIGTRFAAGSLFADLNVGVGYMHSFSAGTVYQKAPSGGIEKVTNWGYSHFMPNASLLLGWDGTRKRNSPFTVHIGPEVYLQSSFNHIYLLHIAAKVGITYKFKQQ